MPGEIEHRVYTLESNHKAFVGEFRQTNMTLKKIELAIEKQNEISGDIRLFRQEFKSHCDVEAESTKRQNGRLDTLETTQSRLAWMVISGVLMAVLTLVLKG